MTTEPHVMDLPPDLPFSNVERSALGSVYRFISERFGACPERETLIRVVAHEEAKKHEAPPPPEAKAASIEPDSILARIDRTHLAAYQKSVLRRAVRQTVQGGDGAFDGIDWSNLAEAIDNVIRPWEVALLSSDPSLDVVTRAILRGNESRAEGDKALPTLLSPHDMEAIGVALFEAEHGKPATPAAPEPSRKRRQPRDVVAGFWSDESAALILKMRDHRDRVATCGAMTPISVGELDAFGDLVREAEIMVRESKMIEEQDRATVQQRIELDRTIGVLCEQVAKARRDKRRAEHARECADERTDAAERQLGLTEEAERPLRDPDEVF